MHAGTCAGSCNTPSEGPYAPSAVFLYNGGSPAVPVTADLDISPLPPVPGAATTLTVTIRQAAAPFAPIPNVTATIFPNIGAGQVTTEGLTNSISLTDANGQFSAVAHYIRDGQYYPSAGTRGNNPPGAPVLPQSIATRISACHTGRMLCA